MARDGRAPRALSPSRGEGWEWGRRRGVRRFHPHPYPLPARGRGPLRGDEFRMADRPFRSAVLAGLVLAVALGLAACGHGGGGESAPERGDRAVAKVDGKTVWSSDVKREAVAQGLIGEGEPLDASSDLFRRVL